jgi:hypothetical protein
MPRRKKPIDLAVRADRLLVSTTNIRATLGARAAFKLPTWTLGMATQ